MLAPVSLQLFYPKVSAEGHREVLFGTPGLRKPAMADGLVGVAAASALVEEFLGWLPCLAVHVARRGMLTQESRRRMQAQLSHFGVLLTPAAPLGFGTRARLLHLLAVMPLLQHNDRQLDGACWHGFFLPYVELRVAVRYQRQRPARPWPRSWRAVRATAVDPSALHTVFRGREFEDALRVLAWLGGDFFRQRLSQRRFRDVGYVQGMQVEVITLFATVLGFELMLRCTTARFYDPDSSGNSSDAETS